jgi:hypothetical protein
MNLFYLFSDAKASETHIGTSERLCNMTTRLFVVGDLKFYAQMLGRDNMSGSWCMWCLMVPNEWNKEEDIPLEHREEWTIDKLEAYKVQVEEGRLKRPTEIHGVVDFPLWDFIEVIYYVYPVLHGEIGLVNNALDGLYDVIDENIEVMSDAEKIARNTAILAHAALESAVENFKAWEASSNIDLSFYEMFKLEVNSNLRQWQISQEQRNQLLSDKEEILWNDSRYKSAKKGA